MAEQRADVDLLSIFEETEATVRARMDGWANEGRAFDVADEEWTDTAPGSFHQLMTEGTVRESALIHDRFTEVLAAATPLFAWGEALDNLAEAAGLERLASTFAEGEVTFTAPPGAAVPVLAGRTVSVPEVGEDDEQPSFTVTLTGTVPGGGSLDLPIRAILSGSAGNVAAGAITETDAPGVDVTNASATFGGTDVEGDESLAVRVIERRRDKGGFTMTRYRGIALNTPGVSEVNVIPAGLGPGSVLLIVSGPDGDPTSETTRRGLQDVLDPPSFRTTLTAPVTLPAGTLAVESTEGAAPATADGPQALRVGDQLVFYTGATATTFTGVTGGAGTFPAGTTIEQGGQGGGLAPAGHNVVVRTSVILDVEVALTVDLEPGFTLDADGAGTPIRGLIEEAVRDYVDRAGKDGEIVIAKILGRVAGTLGVHDVEAVTVEGGTINVPLPVTPVAVRPRLAAVTITVVP